MNDAASPRSLARPLVVGVPFLHEDGRRALEPGHRLIETMDLAEIDGHLEQAQALYTYRPFVVDAGMIARAPRLKIIAAAGSGADHIDIEAAHAAGVVVTHGVGYGALSVAEHAIGLMLAVSKRLVENDAHVRASRSFLDKRHGHLYEEISGSTLAIVGFGAIGRELARMARHGFGMEVIAVTRDGRPAGHPDVGRTLGLREALAAADIVSVNTPLTPQTRGLIGASELAAMKPGALLIDTSRGGVVDAAALHSALVSGHLRGAGVDVFHPEPPPPGHPLLPLDNVVLSPHCAGYTVAASRRLSLAAADCIERALRGEKPKGLIGPEETWTRSRAVRHSAGASPGR